MFIPMTRQALTEWHDQLISRLKTEICAQIRGVFPPAQDPYAIILFGSHARGNYNWRSDVDLMVIHDAFQGIRIIDRGRIFDVVLTITNVDILCYTSAEYLDAYLKGNPTILDALEHGLILYERDQYFSALRACFIEACKTQQFRKEKIAGIEIWHHSSTQ